MRILTHIRGFLHAFVGSSDWPPQAAKEETVGLLATGHRMPLASPQALKFYRENPLHISKAYQAIVMVW
jgi:hypothetical protein